MDMAGLEICLEKRDLINARSAIRLEKQIYTISMVMREIILTAIL